MQIVVTQTIIPADSYAGMMELLKTTMLSHYAKELFNLEVERVYNKHFIWHIINTDESRGLSIVDQLALRGCVDIHIYTTNEVSIDIIKKRHGDCLFRICCTTFEEQ